ncbi:MAG: divergent PAP2 family protein [Dehalococcoidales bacterium]|nr:divergent PAP2 family protein [Dehalococcoidales bacterium]
MFYDLITNWILIIPLCAWVAAQSIKVLRALVQGKGLDLSYFVSSGGMPSAHSAMVSALATAIAMTDGFGSSFFAISVVLAIIVMYDAAGVRQSVGQQSVVLNRIILELKRREPLVKIEAGLRELMGHTPFEVIAGCILGITIAWLWLFLAGL